MIGLEVALTVLLGAFAVLGLLALRRPGLGPAPYWVAGWVSAGLSGIIVLVASDLPLLGLLAFPLGTLFPWLLLAGALELAGRSIPAWLVPLALGFGLARAGLAASGRVELAFGAALPLEPAVTVAAGWLAHRAVSGPGADVALRLLGPSFGVLAVAGSVHVFTLMRGLAPDPLLTTLWMVVTPPVLGIQIYASSESARRAVAGARDDLERRVEERTRELAEAIAALRRSEERYRTVSELSTDFSFAFRVDRELNLTIEWITGAFQRISGVEPEALSGQGWLEFLPPRQREVIPRVLQAAKPGERVFRELPLYAADGSERWVELRAHTEESGMPGALRILGACRDVTERHRMEAERRELERQMRVSERLESLGRLSGGIAHDFNNLLSVIQGNAALADGELSDQEVLRARLGRIRSASEHAARLTDQMLAYAGKTRTVRRTIDVSDAVRQLLELLEAALPDSCTLEVDLAPGLWIEADDVQIQQVVMNLVTNAAEALEEGRGQIELRTAAVDELPGDLEGAQGVRDPRPGPYVVIEIRDSGRGMDSATRELIFEPFFSTKFTGRGMGLASVLGIVRAHRGLAVFESAPERGTIARVLLPRVEAPAHPLEPAEANERGPAPGTRVLVVDDDPDVLELASEFLRREGFEVCCAEGGREGVERLRAEPAEIDAVLLDLSMPEVGGEQAFLEMRAIRPELPIVLATGFSEELTSERFRAPGASGFIRKPYGPEELAACVKAALESARA